MIESAPRLRRIEAFPVEHEGQPCVALRDPAGYTGAIVLLHGPLLDIVSLFDGEHTIADIQAAVMRRHGQLVERRQIEEIAEALDRRGSSEGPAFDPPPPAHLERRLLFDNPPAQHPGRG